MRKDHPSKFIGLDVHHHSITLAIADEGHAVEVRLFLYDCFFTEIILDNPTYLMVGRCYD